MGDGSTVEGGLTGDPTTCAGSASLHSYIGCDYWPTVTANNVWPIFDFAVVVANAEATTANITVTGPGNTNQATTVPPNGLAKIYLPWVAPLKGQDTDPCGTVIPMTASVLARASAYHLVSSIPVTVYQFNALEYQGAGGPNGKSWATCPGTAQICSQSQTGRLLLLHERRIAPPSEHRDDGQLPRHRPRGLGPGEHGLDDDHHGDGGQHDGQHEGLEHGKRRRGGEHRGDRGRRDAVAHAQPGRRRRTRRR